MKPSEPLLDQAKYLQINGLQMYFETYGEGIPLILLHGGLENCQMWAPMIPVLSEKYQLFLPDTRGHGRTVNPSGLFCFPLLAEDIALFIDTLGLHAPLVVGYSDGGQVALHMAMKYTGLARGYLIGGIDNSVTAAWRQMMQGPLGFEGSGKVDFERVMSTNASFISSIEQKHDVFQGPGYWKSLLTQVSQAWWDPPLHSAADFANITDPVLFLCGDRDVFCPPDQSLEMFRLVENAELAVIPNADHFTMAAQWHIVTTILLNFIERVVSHDSP